MDRKIHLINNQGKKKVVEHREFMDAQLLTENKYSDFEVDVNWYLSNGYMTLEDMRKSIEGNGSFSEDFRNG